MRVALIACLLACGKGETTPKKHDDAGLARDAAVVEVGPFALGMPDLEAYKWRARGGHPAFRTARESEATGDWPTVITTCKQALAADPSHLEASWLLAAALGRAGKVDEILVPLTRAVAGDFGKWGHAALELPALEAFRQSATGRAWLARVEIERRNFADAIARSVIVMADGDLYAIDIEKSRWHRLTRTFGAVVGSVHVPEANKIIYVTRAGKKEKKTFSTGHIDLSRGRTTNPISLGTTQPITVAYKPKAPNLGVYVRINKKWQRMDEHNKLVDVPKDQKPPPPYLDVRNRKAKQKSLPAEVTADWDDAGLASAIRIGNSNRVVAVPSPGLIDGNSARWSGDRSRLAFVAQLDDECVPGSISSAAFIAEAATGKLAELERATKGLAIEWVSDQKVAVAGDSGVTIYDLASGTNQKLEGAEGLVSPKKRPKCTAKEPDQPEPEIEVPDETAESSDQAQP